MAFKGTQLQVTRVTVYGKGTGTYLDVDVNFATRDGIVHATTKHTLEVGVTPKIRAAAKQLLDAIQEWGVSTHYEGAEAPKTRKESTFRGLAESLGGSTDPADDGEEQG